MTGLRFSIIYFPLVIAFARPPVASSQDFTPLPLSAAEDRLDKMLVEISAIPMKYSVKGAATYMIRPRDGSDEDIVLVDYVFLKQSLSPTKIRFALMQTSSGDTTHEEHFHYLRNGKSQKFASSFDEIRMDVRELKDHEPLRTMKFLSTDLMVLPLYELAALRLPYGAGYLDLLSRFKSVGGASLQ